jgi:hypothetical protein
MDSTAHLQPFLLPAGFSHIIALLNILRNCIEPEKMQYSEKPDECILYIVGGSFTGRLSD